MNHKRGRSKNRRAGCLLCKPNKMNHAKHKGLKNKEYVFDKIIRDEMNYE